jgi:dynein light chain LC8-type
VCLELFGAMSGGCRWHCFVGRKFSCFVTYEDSKFIYFYVGQTGVVVFAS